MPSQPRNAQESAKQSRRHGPAAIASAVTATVLFAGLLPPLQARLSSQPDAERQRLAPVAAAAAARSAAKPAGQLHRQLAGKTGSASVAAAVLYFGLLPASGSIPAPQANETAAAPTVGDIAEALPRNAEDEVRALAERWSRAWSERDVEAYLAAYGRNFTPGNGVARTTWEESRRQKIEGRKHIAVSVRDLKIDTVGEDRVEVRFLQDYAADKFRETGTPKLLVLAREDGAWRIVAETTDAVRK